MNLIIDCGPLYLTFNYGNQFTQVQFVQLLVNNNASMRKVLSGYLVRILSGYFGEAMKATYQSELY